MEKVWVVMLYLIYATKIFCQSSVFIVWKIDYTTGATAILAPIVAVLASFSVMHVLAHWKGIPLINFYAVSAYILWSMILIVLWYQPTSGAGVNEYFVITTSIDGIFVIISLGTAGFKYIGLGPANKQSNDDEESMTRSTPRPLGHSHPNIRCLTPPLTHGLDSQFPHNPLVAPTIRLPMERISPQTGVPGLRLGHLPLYKDITTREITGVDRNYNMASEMAALETVSQELAESFYLNDTVGNAIRNETERSQSRDYRGPDALQSLARLPDHSSPQNWVHPAFRSHRAELLPPGSTASHKAITTPSDPIRIAINNNMF